MGTGATTLSRASSRTSSTRCVDVNLSSNCPGYHAVLPSLLSAAPVRSLFRSRCCFIRFWRCCCRCCCCSCRPNGRCCRCCCFCHDQVPFEAVDVWVPLCDRDQEGSEVVLFHAGYFTNVRGCFCCPCSTKLNLEVDDICCDPFAPPGGKGIDFFNLQQCEREGGTFWHPATGRMLIVKGRGFW